MGGSSWSNSGILAVDTGREQPAHQLLIIERNILSSENTGEQSDSGSHTLRQSHCSILSDEDGRYQMCGFSSCGTRVMGFCLYCRISYRDPQCGGRLGKSQLAGCQ